MRVGSIFGVDVKVCFVGSAVGSGASVAVGSVVWRVGIGEGNGIAVGAASAVNVTDFGK